MFYIRGAATEVIGDGILITSLSIKLLAEAIFKVYISKKVGKQFQLQIQLGTEVYNFFIHLLNFYFVFD